MGIQNLVFVGAAVNLFGSLLYIRDTVRGVTKPNRVSFIMWTVTPFIAFSAAIADGAGLAALPVFISGFVTFIVLMVSFFNQRAYWKSTAFDYWCGICSLLALILWGLTGQPVVAIALTILGDVFATLPTFIKSWHYPATETGIAYVAGLFSAMTSFAAARAWAFSEIAFPMWIVIGNSCLLFAIYRHKLKEYSW